MLGILKGLLDIYSNTVGYINSEQSNSTSTEEDLKAQWIKELNYSTDEKLQEILDRENLSWKYNFTYYGRYRIIEVIADYMVKNNRKPYY